MKISKISRGRLLCTVAGMLLVSVYTGSTAAQDRVDPLVLETIEQRGIARVIVSMEPPRIGEDVSRAYAAPTGFLTEVAGGETSNIMQLADLPAAVLETDAEGISDLLARPEVSWIQLDEPMEPLLYRTRGLMNAEFDQSTGPSGAGFAIAVLDTGVETSHAFFSDRIVAEACFSLNDEVVAAPNVTSLCPDGLYTDTRPGAADNCGSLDRCDHGTHVAGIATGADGQLGTLRFDGMAPGANLMPVQVFTQVNSGNDCGRDPAPCLRSYLSNQVVALEHIVSLVDQGEDVAVVNMSMGGRLHGAACDLRYPRLAAGIRDLRVRGVATVIASGNDGSHDSVTVPSCITDAITVGGTLANDREIDPRYSNRSSLVDFVAPGTFIFSSGDHASGYEPMLGTSMAAPHVAGAVALLRSAQPSASVDAIEASLRLTAIPVEDPETGRLYGFPDVRSAMANLQSRLTEPAFVVSAVEGDQVRLQTLDEWAETGGRLLISPRTSSGLPTFASTSDAVRNIFRLLGPNASVIPMGDNVFSVQVPEVSISAQALLGVLGPETLITREADPVWFGVEPEPEQ